MEHVRGNITATLYAGTAPIELRGRNSVMFARRRQQGETVVFNHTDYSVIYYVMLNLFAFLRGLVYIISLSYQLRSIDHIVLDRFPIAWVQIVWT